LRAEEAPAPSRMKGALRREQLFEIALELFSTKGYLLTSVDDIAGAAGVTKPVFYQHFVSKEALYRELLENVASEMLHAVEAVTSTTSSPREQVEQGFRAYFRYVAEHESAFNLLFGRGVIFDEECASVIDTVERTMAQMVAGLIEAGIGDEHRLLLGYGIVGLAAQTGRLWLQARKDGALIGRMPADPDLLARWVAEIAWGGLRGITRD
jgi:AcrR family transcriptional regulator